MLLISNFILSYNCGITIHRSPAIIPRNSITVIITEHVLEAFLAFFLVFMSLSSNKVRNNLSKNTSTGFIKKAITAPTMIGAAALVILLPTAFTPVQESSNLLITSAATMTPRTVNATLNILFFLSSDIFSLPQLKYFYDFRLCIHRNYNIILFL